MERNPRGSVYLKALVIISLLGLAIAQVAWALHRASLRPSARPLPLVTSPGQPASSPASPPASPSAPSSRQTTVVVRLPSPAEELTASPGSVVIVLENQESKPVGLRLEGLAAEITPIAPGGRARVTAELGPGTYTLSVLRAGSAPVPLRLVVR